MKKSPAKFAKTIMKYYIEATNIGVEKTFDWLLENRELVSPNFDFSEATEFEVYCEYASVKERIEK